MLVCDIIIPNTSRPSLTTQVRLEFLHVIGDWILNLRERMDHEHRLMPYLISALNDESALIQV